MILKNKPQYWIRYTLRRHDTPLPDLPGSGVDLEHAAGVAGLGRTGCSAEGQGALDRAVSEPDRGMTRRRLGGVEDVGREERAGILKLDEVDRNDRGPDAQRLLDGGANPIDRKTAAEHAIDRSRAERVRGSVAGGRQARGRACPRGQ